MSEIKSLNETEIKIIKSLIEIKIYVDSLFIQKTTKIHYPNLMASLKILENKNIVELKINNKDKRKYFFKLRNRSVWKKILFMG